MTWSCFLIVATLTAEQSLRRYRCAPDRDQCSGAYGYHNAEVVIGTLAPFSGTLVGDATHAFPHDDPRWPTHCACGYAFTPEDEWQYNLQRLYTRADGSGQYTLRRLPVGAVHEAPWLVERAAPPTPEQIAAGTYPSFLSPHYWRDWYGVRAPLFVQCPGLAAGWCVDQRSNNGDGWTVTGRAPDLTAAPSIALAQYHGFLRMGVLTDDLEGRRYDDAGRLLR